MLGVIYQLDKFHLKRAIPSGISHDPPGAEVYQAYINGEIEKADVLLIEIQQRAAGERREAITELIGYLMSNCYGLRDYWLARLISLREMGLIHHWITHKDTAEDKRLSTTEISRSKVTKRKDNGAWLKAETPALYGPH